MNKTTPLYDGLIEINRQRLETLIDVLKREILLAAPYPEVQARLRAQQRHAQRVLDTLPLPSGPISINTKIRTEAVPIIVNQEERES